MRLYERYIIETHSKNIEENNKTKWTSNTSLNVFLPPTLYPKPAFENREICIKSKLRKELGNLRHAWMTHDGYKSVIREDTSMDNCDLSEHTIFLIRFKCKYFATLIDLILSHYDDMTLNSICQKTIDKVQAFEHTFQLEDETVEDKFPKFKHSRSLQNSFHKYVQNNYRIVNPSYKTSNEQKNLPPFLNNNPDFKTALVRFCDENLVDLTGEMVFQYVSETGLPQLLQKRKEEIGEVDALSFDLNSLLQENGLKILNKRTIYNWLRRLGYKYKTNGKGFYTDGHERPETVKYREEFVKKYLNEYEMKCARWFQIKETDYQLWQNNNNKTEKFRSDGYKYEENGIIFLEFHVDDIPREIYIRMCHECPFGGNISIRMPSSSKQIIIFGQDECIFMQFTLRRKSWIGRNGKRGLLPKGEGGGVMVSAFKSREFGFGMELTQQQLDEINKKRKNESYSDEEAAVQVHGNKKKKDLRESPFIKKFHYGANKEGYWNYEDMVIQMEDCIDCLKYLFGDKYEYVFLVDHSNGHDRLRPDGLSVSKISKNFGGKQPNMRDTKIKDESYLGPYIDNIPNKLEVGQIQSLVFKENDVGPCDLSLYDRNDRKYDKVKGTKTRPLIKDELIKSLSSVIKKPMGTKEQLQKLCKDNNMPIDVIVEDILEGWVGKPKGSLQLLYERGWINPQCIHSYTKKGPTDIYGMVQEELSLSCLLEKQPDFQEQETLLQYHARLLGCEVVRTPKCHPEIAGEGIEYDWGGSKLWYRSVSLQSKKRKKDFLDLVDRSLSKEVLSLERTRSYCKRARDYMLTYLSLMTHKEDTASRRIEMSDLLINKCVKMMKTSKTHRNVLDSDTRFLSDVLVKTIKMVSSDRKCDV